MLYRVSAKVLNGKDRLPRTIDVEASSGDEAAAKAHDEFKKEAGLFVVIVSDVRPAPIDDTPAKKNKAKAA